jgi:hypothetical protein
MAAIESDLMKHTIRNTDDLRWLIGHTGGFRSGYVTDLHMAKRRLFDEESGREVLADTTVTLTIRYQVRGLLRVAKLTMAGVTDFSVFEQEGADCSSLDVIQAEWTAGRLRYWFDPHGELYVVCEETQFEEMFTPITETQPLTELARWTFQGQTSDGPTVEWLLAELARAGVPCSWVPVHSRRTAESIVSWEGDLTPSDITGDVPTQSVRVLAYQSPGDEGFGLVLRVLGAQDGQGGGRVLRVLADQITHRYAGTCLVGTTIIPGREWEQWRAHEGRA